MLAQGPYDEGRFVVIAPALNHHVQTAVSTYRAHLAEPRPEQVGFVGLTLEAVITALGRAGAPDYARALLPLPRLVGREPRPQRRPRTPGCGFVRPQRRA